MSPPPQRQATWLQADRRASPDQGRRITNGIVAWPVAQGRPLGLVRWRSAGDVQLLGRRLVRVPHALRSHRYGHLQKRTASVVRHPSAHKNMWDDMRGWACFHNTTAFVKTERWYDVEKRIVLYTKYAPAMLLVFLYIGLTDAWWTSVYETPLACADMKRFAAALVSDPPSVPPTDDNVAMKGGEVVMPAADAALSSKASPAEVAAAGVHADLPVPAANAERVQGAKPAGENEVAAIQASETNGGQVDGATQKPDSGSRAQHRCFLQSQTLECNVLRSIVLHSFKYRANRVDENTKWLLDILLGDGGREIPQRLSQHVCDFQGPRSAPENRLLYAQHCLSS